MKDTQVPVPFTTDPCLEQDKYSYKLCLIIIYKHIHNLKYPNCHHNAYAIVGSKYFPDNIDLLLNVALTISLVLANHCSCIDWMVGISVINMLNYRCILILKMRVVFVCEALIKFITIVYWYHSIVTDYVIVWRSFGLHCVKLFGMFYLRVENFKGLFFNFKCYQD